MSDTRSWAFVVDEVFHLTGRPHPIVTGTLRVGGSIPATASPMIPGRVCISTPATRPMEPAVKVSPARTSSIGDVLVSPP